MYEAKQIAKWFINRAGESTKLGGEYLTQLKLQKLMYYAQGFYFVFENKPLFNDVILAREFGPVVNTIVKQIKKHANNPIKEEFNSANDITDPSVINILEFVFEKVGQFSAYALVSLTHNEQPWKNAKQGQEISSEEICQYFRDKYIINFDKKNKFNITEEDILNISFKNIYQENKHAFEVLAKC